jgi:hypothetical protein
MVEEPSHVKQLSLNHVCKIGLILTFAAFISKTESITLFTVTPRSMGFAIGVAVGGAVSVAVTMGVTVAVGMTMGVAEEFGCGHGRGCGHRQSSSIHLWVFLHQEHEAVKLRLLGHLSFLAMLL